MGTANWVDPNRELGTSDIARLRGIDRSTAYRWLKELHARYGESVVHRRGKRGALVTTAGVLAKVAGGSTDIPVTDQRVRDLEQRLTLVEARLDESERTIAWLRTQLRAH